MRVLGLDVSTSVTGITVLDDGDMNEPRVVHMGHVDFKGCDDLWDKVTRLENRLLDVKGDHGPFDAVYIEEALLGFRAGMSNANTITTLVKFNGICGYIVSSKIGRRPKFVSAPHARKLCGIRTLSVKSSGVPVKEQVFAWAREGPFIGREWATTRTGKYQPWNMDEVDSYVIARAGLVIERTNIVVQSDDA